MTVNVGFGHLAKVALVRFFHSLPSLLATTDLFTVSIVLPFPVAIIGDLLQERLSKVLPCL